MQKFTPENSGTSEIAGTSISDDQDDKDGDQESKKKKNRCGVCRKKVGLTGKGIHSHIISIGRFLCIKFYKADERNDTNTNDSLINKY